MSIALSGRGLKCIDLHRIAHGEATSLCEDAAADMTENVASMPDGPSILEQKRHWLVGGFADTLSADELCRVFILGHCAGVGDPLAKPLVRATMAARANVLATATTGCRPDAARVLIDMLNQDVVPLVPSQGSVGAAGDLAPLAHIARVACGYAERPASILDYRPNAKEALALINGVSMTAALGAVATVRARRVLDVAIAAAAMTMEAVGAGAGCIDPRLLAARNHPGDWPRGSRGPEGSGGSTQRGARHAAIAVRRRGPREAGAEPRRQSRAATALHG